MEEESEEFDLQEAIDEFIAFYVETERFIYTESQNRGNNASRRYTFFRNLSAKFEEIYKFHMEAEDFSARWTYLRQLYVKGHKKQLNNKKLSPMERKVSQMCCYLRPYIVHRSPVDISNVESDDDDLLERYPYFNVNADENNNDITFDNVPFEQPENLDELAEEDWPIDVLEEHIFDIPSKLNAKTNSKQATGTSAQQEAPTKDVLNDRNVHALQHGASASQVFAKDNYRSSVIVSPTLSCQFYSKENSKAGPSGISNNRKDIPSTIVSSQMSNEGNSRPPLQAITQNRNDISATPISSPVLAIERNSRPVIQATTHNRKYVPATISSPAMAIAEESRQSSRPSLQDITYSKKYLPATQISSPAMTIKEDSRPNLQIISKKIASSIQNFSQSCQQGRSGSTLLKPQNQHLQRNQESVHMPYSEMNLHTIKQAPSEVTCRSDVKEKVWKLKKRSMKSSSKKKNNFEVLKDAIKNMGPKENVDQSTVSRVNIICEQFDILPKEKKGIAFIKVMQIFKRFIESKKV